jgi:hypothetical protein
MIQLSDKTRFSSGGNRDCFRHPDNAGRCLKTLRACRTPQQRRQEKQFPANLRPLSSFDENLVELNVLNYLHANYPVSVRQHLPECFGLIDTDLGKALETSLIVDHDAQISQTLEQYLWEFGLDAALESAISAFKSNWSQQPPKTRDLIPHNLVVQNQGERHHLVLIDGFGRMPRFTGINQIFSGNRQFARRMRDFDHRIQKILHLKSTKAKPPGRLTNLKR